MPMLTRLHVSTARVDDEAKQSEFTAVHDHRLCALPHAKDASLAEPGCTWQRCGVKDTPLPEPSASCITSPQSGPHRSPSFKRTALCFSTSQALAAKILVGLSSASVSASLPRRSAVQDALAKVDLSVSEPQDILRWQEAEALRACWQSRELTGACGGKRGCSRRTARGEPEPEGAPARQPLRFNSVESILQYLHGE